MLAEDHDYADTADEENAFGARTAAVDEELFSILKDLRKKISKQKDVPPFVIFQDPSLEDMAIQYPITIENSRIFQAWEQEKHRDTERNLLRS